MTPEQEKIYEDGFLAGQEQLIKSSVHRAVNRMAQRTWVGLTDEERSSFWTADQMTHKEWDELFNAIEAKLKDKNT